MNHLLSWTSSSDYFQIIFRLSSIHDQYPSDDGFMLDRLVSSSNDVHEAHLHDVDVDVDKDDRSGMRSLKIYICDKR